MLVGTSTIVYRLTGVFQDIGVSGWFFPLLWLFLDLELGRKLLSQLVGFIE